MKGLDKVLQSEGFKNGMKEAANWVKNGCAIAVPILVMSIVDSSAKRVSNKIHFERKVGYDDAVKAILDSSMLSSYKREAVALLNKNDDSDYYKAVVYAINSSLLSGDKIEMIKNLSKVEKEGDES